MYESLLVQYWPSARRNGVNCVLSVRTPLATMDQVPLSCAKSRAVGSACEPVGAKKQAY